MLGNRVTSRRAGSAYMRSDMFSATPFSHCGSVYRARIPSKYARVGSESRYRARVREGEFRSLAAAAGLRIADEKVFNTDLKRLYPLVPPERSEAFMDRWLAYELELNELGIEYRDELASIFRTRNFVLEAVPATRAFGARVR